MDYTAFVEATVEFGMITFDSFVIFRDNENR